MRSAICTLLALLTFVAPAMAEIAPDNRHGHLTLAEPCIAVTAARVDPLAMFNNAAAFDCTSGQIGVYGPVTWGVFRNLSINTDPSDPWELRHTLSQAADETIFAHYADGRFVRVTNDRMAARRTFAANQFSFVLPTQPGVIDAILIRAEGLQNQRGIAPLPELITGRAALDDDIKYLALYGILAGAVFALLVFNMALFVVLRARYILYYCTTALLMLFVGAAWSGAIFAVMPWMDPTTQISVTLLCASAMLLSVTFFMLEFIEPEVRSPLAARMTLAAGLVGLASSIIRLVDVRFAWDLMDKLTYGAMIAVLLGITVTAAIGWIKGGEYARNYLIAWSIPTILAMLRALWALGLIERGTLLIEITPLVVMAVEALVSAVAVGWRIGSVRKERDDAFAMKEQFRQIAEVDALTGLLTRRGFLRGVETRADRIKPIKLILIDIDQFKLINDRHGHQVGDDVLVLVASILRKTAPDGALIGRLGGEEFGLVLVADPIGTVADSLRKAVAEAIMVNEISVTISIGVAESCVDNEADWRELYHAADQALYRSKNGGRNRVSHAPQPMAA